ncbi:uncharacterized protein LOC131353922 isoform X5 [Hemibagrus wyckioides]|uniref:uncharacterized protein LOC131353922 isoform X5 n=1 Tax=Hemibagrus wyckioides TaxID=337641 RepID=UPI00266DCC9E|nr:uncharacterized protein LOC131353922 isoform X5 [Hemibagrus wyckioides]
MASQGPGRKRTPNRNAVTPEEDALNVIAREAEARLAAKRAARAEAREIRMKELERQQKEIYQVQKKYYGLENLDNKWGDIEQWMEDSERYTRHSQRHVSVSDDEECMSLGSRSNVRLDLDSVGAQTGLSHTSTFNSHKNTKKKKKKTKNSSDISNGYDNDYRTNSSRGSLYESSLCSSSLRSNTRTLSEYSGLLGSSSRASSRASSRCASPVENSSSSGASFLRKAASSSGLRDLDHVTIPDLPNLDEGLDRDFFEKGPSRASTLSAATLTSLGGASSRKGSDSSSVTADTETSLQDIKEIHELKDQIQDVEAKYMQSLKELKDSLAQMEEKYRKAMVSNAQLDNEKSNLIYEVDTLKDSLMELEELLAETRRECEEKSKDLEREKHAHSILQFQFIEQKETLKQSEELLTALEKQKEYSDAIRTERDELRDEVVQLKDILKKHGIVLGPDLCTNGEVEGNVSSGSACTELQHGSSVLGTQELQLFRDENVGGSRGGQFQHQQDFDHEVQENHLPPSVSGSSSESPVVAHYNNGGFGNDFNNSIAKIQNNVEKPQAACEGKAEEISKDNVIIEGMRTDQQEIPLHDNRSETIKEENQDFTEKLPCEIAEKDVVHLDETVVGDSQIKMISDSSPSAKIDTALNSQSASVSGKKKKKKRKNKQKQKQSSDEKAVRSEIGDENENQLAESSSVQTVEENSVCSEEAPINEKVPDNRNVDENIELMHKEAESLELQRPNTGPGSISNQTDCMSSADFFRTADSVKEIKIDVPAYDDPLERTTEELNASIGKYKILSNNGDAELKDIVAVCADFPESGFEVRPEKEETDTTSDVVEMETVDGMIHLDKTYALAETSTVTQLDDAVITNEVSEEGQEIATDTQLDDALVTDEMHEEGQETSTVAQLDDAVITNEVSEEGQVISTVTQLDDAVITNEVSEEGQVISTVTQLDDAVITNEVSKEGQVISTVTQLDDALVTDKVHKLEQDTSTVTQLDDAVITNEVSEEGQETSTVTQLDDALVTDKVPELEQDSSTVTQLDGVLVTDEVPEQGQEISTDTQLDDALVTDEIPEESQEISTVTQLDDALVTDEMHEEGQETSTVTQLDDAVITNEVSEEGQEISTVTQLDDALVTDKVPELEQDTSTVTQLDGVLVTDKIPEERQEISTVTQLDGVLVTDKIPEERQEISTVTQLDGVLVTDEVPEEELETSAVTQLNEAVVADKVPEKEQETSAVKQLDDGLVTAEVPEEEQETYKETQLDDTVVTDEAPKLEQETSTGTQLDDVLFTAEVPEVELETSAVTQLNEAVVANKVAEKEQETSAVKQLDDGLVTAEVPEEKQESQEPTQIDQEFKVEQDEGEVEYGESFECHQEHNNIPDHKVQTDEQNVSAEIAGVTAEQIATTGGNQNESQQHSLTGYEEQGPEGCEETGHFEHSERAKQETSPNDLLPETRELDEVADDVVLQEAGQNMREQEVSEVKEGTSETNKEDAKSGSKKESKKGKGKSKEDCKMS